MDQRAKEKRAKYLNLLIFAAILIVMSVLSTLFSKGFEFHFEADSMSITDSEDNTCTVLYGDITSMEIVESPDWGTCVDGDSSRSYRWGTWENDAWGRYTMYTSTAADICILIRTDTQVIALSYESDDVTTGLMDSLNEAIAATRE